MTGAVSRETEVLVVGAGATGLIMACELWRRGIACRIIEQAAASQRTSRAIGVQPRTLEVFQAMGLSDAILAQGTPISAMNFYVGEQRLLHTDFRQARSNLHTPYTFTLVEPQYLIEQVLTEQLHRLGGTIERSCELVDFHQEHDHVRSVVTDAEGAQEEISARHLIGCDGAHSRVRKILGLPFEGAAYDEAFILADVDLDWHRNREEINFWLQSDKVFGVFPLPQGHWRLTATVSATAPPPASLDLFQRLLAERTGDTTTRISNPLWLSNFTISRRMVTSYRQGNTFLAGDAAHIHSPFGGLGMNTGIQDAYNLGWKLALVLKGQAAPSLLDTYQEERLPVARDVLHETDRNTRLFLAKNPALRFVRDHILFHLLSIDVVQASTAGPQSQLAINYRSSSLSHSYHGPSPQQSTAPMQPGDGTAKRRVDAHTGPKAGDRAPDGHCQRFPSLEATSLFQEFAGTTWSLLLFNGLASKEGEASELVKVAQQIKSMLGDEVKTSLVLSSQQRAEQLNWNGAILLDPNGELHTLYGAEVGTMYLVRPDGYIGFRGQPVREEPLQEYLQSMFTYVSVAK